MADMVYKIPSNITPAEIVALVGSEGTVPNPVQDVNDNWVISKVTWDNPEFDGVKAMYGQYLAGFELIEWAGRKLPAELIGENYGT